jgi:uncharacterized protein (DUF488 family)
MIEFVTIGVYGWDEERFFETLQKANVDLLVDIRRRRGVRGPDYPFANSNALQARLDQLGIRYLHRIDLSPSDALRKRQHEADESEHVARRKRTELSPEFTEGYEREIMSHFDSRQFIADLGPETRVAGLLCVEREPAACHRGLLAARLVSDLGVKITHLTP